MPTARYTVMGGRIVAEKRGGVRKFYSSDALGSTVALYDDSQTKTDTFTYWPYGETRTRTGSTATKYKYVGTLGCREQADGGIYMQARVEQPEDGRWMTVDPMWPLSLPFSYAHDSPATLSDSSGLFPTPDCSGMSDCLSKTPDCGGQKSISIYLMFCVFWQESNFGDKKPPGGIGSCTLPCFKTLQNKGCFKQFKDYADFRKNATDCEKAQAAYAFIQIVGLEGYGPGKGKPGDYRGITGEKVRTCESCIMATKHKCWQYFGGPPPPLNEICGYCFVTTVHR